MKRMSPNQGPKTAQWFKDTDVLADPAGGHGAPLTEQREPVDVGAGHWTIDMTNGIGNLVSEFSKAIEGVGVCCDRISQVGVPWATSQPAKNSLASAKEMFRQEKERAG